MPEPTARGVRQLEVGSVLTRSLKLYFSHLGIFLPMVLVFQAISYLGNYLVFGTLNPEEYVEKFRAAGNSPDALLRTLGPLYLYLFLLVLFSLVMYGAIIHAALDILQGQGRASVGRSLLAGVRYWPQNFLWTFVIGCGFVCCFVPGIFLLCVYGTFLPAVMAENRGINAASERASSLSSGSRWSILALVVLMSLMSCAVSIPIGFSQLFIHDFKWQIAVNVIIGCLNPAFLTMWIPVLYHELVALHEGGEEKTVEQIFT